MARKALIVKQEKYDQIRLKYNEILKENKNLSWEEKYKLYRKYKWKTKHYNRCKVTGRVGSYNRELWICRVTLRTYAREWKLMWIRKSSW